MTNKDKIVKEVAEKLNLPITTVQGVVESQLNLVRVSVLNKLPVTIYLRKVGSFISPQVAADLKEKRRETIEGNKLKRQQKKLNIGEDPTHF